MPNFIRRREQTFEQHIYMRFYDASWLLNLMDFWSKMVRPTGLPLYLQTSKCNTHRF